MNEKLIQSAGRQLELRNDEQLEPGAQLKPMKNNDEIFICNSIYYILLQINIMLKTNQNYSDQTTMNVQNFEVDFVYIFDLIAY